MGRDTERRHLSRSQTQASKFKAEWAGLEGLLELRSRLHAWVQADPRIQAAVAFGSTERADRPADPWSDLDLLFVVDDVAPWFDDLSWVEAISRSWLRLVNESPVPEIRVVQALFAGGYDVDLVPVGKKDLGIITKPEFIAELFGHGFRIVFDRIGAFDGLPQANGGVPVTTDSGMRPPSSGEFQQTVAIFLYQTVWATKRLLRGERWRAHDDVDDYMRDRLLTMIEWHAMSIGVDGVFPESRKLEAWIPPRVAAELPATFAQYDDVSIARALVRGHALFRKLAREVASRWEFDYPDEADAHVEAWVRARLAESPLGAQG